MKLSTSLPNTLLLFAGLLLGYEGCAPRNVGKASPSGGQSDTRKAHHTPEETLPDSLIEKVRNTDLKRFLRNLRNNPGAIDTKATSEDNPVAYTALQLAVSEKNIKVLEGLLKVGANPNVVLDPYRKHTALLEAATILHPNAKKAIQALLEAGADALHQDSYGNTALHLVAAWENVDTRTHKTVIELLLAKEPDILVNLKGGGNKTPLEIAKQSNQDKEIISLLELKTKEIGSQQTGSPDSIEQILSGPLISEVRDSDLLQRLRELRKDPTQINNKNDHGETLLLQAIRNNELKVFQALLKAKADPHHVKKKGVDTTLHYAVREKRSKFVKVLLEQDVSLNWPGHLRNTPLHIAVSTGGKTGGKEILEIISMLAMHPGIDFHKANVRELTPLAIAEANGNRRIADILRQHGAEH
jgi:ankyrin repeat protein